MVLFNELLATDAILHGRNITCLYKRTVVCKAKKKVIIGYNSDTALIKKGDEVLCTYNDRYNDRRKDKEITITSKRWVREIASQDLLLNEPDEVFWRYKSYNLKMNLQEFSDTFEVLNDDTAMIENDLNVAYEMHEKLVSASKEIKDLQEVCNTAGSIRQILYGVYAILLSVLNFTIVGKFIREGALSVFIAIFGFIWIAVAAFLIINGICYLTDETEFHLSLLNPHRYKRKVKEAINSYNKLLDTSVELLDKNREHTQWLK